MRCLVFGAGAVGGYLGAKLIQAGCQVTLLARPAAAEAFQKHGLLLKEPLSSRHYSSFKAIHNLAASDAAEPDFILLTVKAYDCEQAAAQISSTGWQAPVVSFTNGVGCEEILSQRLPAGVQIVAATLTTAVERPQPWQIQISKERGVGLQDAPGVSSPLAQAFARAGLKVETYDDPESLKWSKLLSNLIGNATAALTGLSVGQIYADPALFRLELAALREARLVLLQAGHRPLNLPGLPIGWLARVLRLPAFLLQPVLRRLAAGGRGGKRPSMYYDVNRGRTEVEWLNGAVVKEGLRLGVPTPANRLLTEQVEAMDGRRRLEPKQLLDLAAAAGVDGLAGYNRGGI